MQAARNEDLNTVKLLLEHGAAADALDNSGRTALHFAADGGHPTVVQLLLDAGAAVDAQVRRLQR